MMLFFKRDKGIAHVPHLTYGKVERDSINVALHLIYFSSGVQCKDLEQVSSTTHCM